MRRTVLLLLMVAALVLLLLASPAVAAGKVNPKIIPPQATPHGATYGEWGASWWQWALSLPYTGDPQTENPILAGDGWVDLSKGQTGSVWYLAGAFPGVDVTRSGTVPPGKALFFPVANWVWVATEPDESFDEGLALVQEAMDTVEGMSVTIDGVPVSGLEDVLDSPYRFSSPRPFVLTLPENNLLSLDAGEYGPAACDGVWLMLTPLSVGNHTISFQYSNWGDTATITYDLTVSPKVMPKRVR